MMTSLPKSFWAALAALGAVTLLLSPTADPQGRAKRNRYVGAKTCENCHKEHAKGEQYQKWEKTGHAKAYEALASDKAKAIAKERGIKDPQKDDKCIKCHSTAHGVSRRQIKRGFDHKAGVQCETCHGPGERHVKARFAAAQAGKVDPAVYQPTPKGEIIVNPGFDTCHKCHNDESPTFKPFCFKARNAKIVHLDPRKKRTAEELAAMKCQCGDSCSCKQAECSKAPAKKADTKGESGGDK